jgi:signal transduction histidine kinase
MLPIAVQEVLARAPDNFPGADWRGMVFVGLGLVGARWARERPQATLVLLTLATAPIVVFVYGLSYQPPFTPGITMVLTIFSLEAYDATARARLVLAAFAATTLVYCVLAQAHGVLESGNIWAQWVLYALAVTAGVLVRRRREENVELGDRLDEVERTREQRAQQAVEQERARIARELHDVIAHSVSVMVIQASVERRDVVAGPTRDALASIETTGRETLAELRRLLGILRHDGSPPGLAPQPGLGSLNLLAEQVGEAGLAVDLDVATDVGPLAPGLELSVYRIVQEALTNALKHAHAGHARVAVRRRAGEVELEIVDDGAGRGLSARADGGGHGLVGMRERASLYGGTLTAGAAPGGGFRVSARLPVEPAAS